MKEDPARNSELDDKAEPATASPGKRPCPKCGWHNVRLARTSGAVDLVLSVFAITPFRCRSCGHRFYRFFRRGASR
jgi:hypothetical protein